MAFAAGCPQSRSGRAGSMKKSMTRVPGNRIFNPFSPMGRPNSAASSFCSTIIREPMQGQRATCPVDPTLPLWIQSPRLAVQNLLHAGRLEVGDSSRIITVPGITVSSQVAGCWDMGKGRRAEGGGE